MLHVVVHRALKGQSAFLDDEDRRAYLQALQAAAREAGVAVHGYGMDECEVRLLVTPSTAAAYTYPPGLRDEIDVLVTVESPSLRWALRDFPRARFVPGLAANEAPSVVITLKNQETPVLAQAYRGQDFNWRVYPGWEGPLPPNAPAWLAFRQAPLLSEQVVLWARIDLFPDRGLSQPGQPAELPEPAAPAEQEQVMP